MVTTHLKMTEDEYPVDCNTNDVSYFFIRELDARFRTFTDVNRETISSSSGSAIVPEDEAHLFKQLLAAHPNGIPSLKLATAYEERFGRPLDFGSWGFRKLSDLIFNNPDLFTIQNFDENTAKLFPDSPTDYIVHDHGSFKVPLKFDTELKLNAFRLVLEFNNNGERFPVRHFVEYYRSYYEEPKFEFDIKLVKPLFKILSMEFPIEIEGSLDDLHKPTTSKPTETRQEQESLKENSRSAVSTNSLVRRQTYVSPVREKSPRNVDINLTRQFVKAPSTTSNDNSLQLERSPIKSIGNNSTPSTGQLCDKTGATNMDGLWLSKSQTSSLIDDVDNANESIPEKPAQSGSIDDTDVRMDLDNEPEVISVVPPISFTHKDNPELKMVYYNKNELVNKAPGPFARPKSQVSIFKWRKHAVKRGNAHYLVQLSGRKDLPKDACLPGSGFVDYQFPYGTETLGDESQLCKATIIGVASPRRLFIHSSGRREFEELTIEMNQFYNGLPDDGGAYTVPEWFLYRSFPCAVCVDLSVDKELREWERSKVVGVDGEYVFIEAIDYAGTRRIPLSEVRLLANRFISLPIQSIRIKMMAIEQRDENEQRWKKAKTRLNNFSLPDYELDCAFYERNGLLSKKSRHFEVIMFDRNDPDIDICVNDVVVLEGYAKYNEEQKSEYIKRRDALKSALATVKRPVYNPDDKIVDMT